MKYFLLVILILQIVCSDLAGQEWIVPDDKRGKLSTFPFDENTRKEGEKLYSINCISCHGIPGKANYLNLIPPPGDPATDKIQRNNDGEIFYKVTMGRGQMPSFRSILSSNEVWKIISYFRSFSNTYKQQIMPVITSSAFPDAIIKLLLSYNSADSTVVLNATAVKDNSVEPVYGAEVKLYVYRTFGLLQVDEAKFTDKKGIAVFRVPDDLPGDTSGNILVSARFVNEDIYGSVGRDTLLCAAKKTIPVSLIAERAMWNSVRKAPVWIILTYGLSLLATWCFVIFVLMKLRDIYIIGGLGKTDNPEKKN